jgi:hypothetical protein
MADRCPLATADEFRQLVHGFHESTPLIRDLESVYQEMVEWVLRDSLADQAERDQHSLKLRNLADRVADDAELDIGDGGDDSSSSSSDNDDSGNDNPQPTTTTTATANATAQDGAANTSDENEIGVSAVQEAGDGGVEEENDAVDTDIDSNFNNDPTYVGTGVGDGRIDDNISTAVYVSAWLGNLPYGPQLTHVNGRYTLQCNCTLYNGGT